MLNYYLLAHIFSYLSCQQKSSLRTNKWLSSIGTLHENMKCLSETCARLYWISLTHKNLPYRSTQTLILKECCSRARIQYIRGIHYRLRESYQIWTNYL